MSNRPKTRLINGFVSAFIVAFFFAHGTLGSALLTVGIRSSFAYLVWFGVALVFVHVAMSVVTSYQQLTDKVDPPSIRKKRHLALKWITGVVLLAFICIHVGCLRMFGLASTQSMATGALVIILLAITLAAHVCVGAKSLLKDIGASRRYRTLVRIVACAFAVLFSLAAIAWVLGTA